eukprot:TRINITY_DN259_c0_g1_i1.p1 TRINITY_DN259_c0_g1~~TRINITY_DN259_c0_g1_i1.p1  ORF type:complete len:1610 (+),score=327.67 TRINITY_DN259_c0_g1_i1:120-4949(+)
MSGVAVVDDDDAWIEAELERQLLGTSAEGDDDEDDTPASKQPQPEDAQNGDPLEHLPDSFRELMARLQEWGESEDKSAEEGIKEAMEEAQGIERVLEEPTAPPILEFPDAPYDKAPEVLESERPAIDAPEALESERLDNDEGDAAGDDAGQHATDFLFDPAEDVAAVLARFTSEARAAALAELKSPTEGDPVQVNANHSCIESSEMGETGHADMSPEDKLPIAVVADEDPAVAQDLAEEPRAPSPVLQPASELSAVEQQQQDDDAMEQLQRRIEEERQACLAELERQHQEMLRQMQLEEEARKVQQDRLREEVAMHSEELWAREFQQYERNSHWREWRAMRSEDRRSSNVRNEERLILENAERGREAAERQAMAREDVLATAVRQRERELQEAAWLAVEDSKCQAWRSAVLLEAERSRTAAADNESFRWQEAVKEARETTCMSSEDKNSATLRLCMLPGVAVSRTSSDYCNDSALHESSSLLHKRLGLAGGSRGVSVASASACATASASACAAAAAAAAAASASASASDMDVSSVLDQMVLPPMTLRRPRPRPAPPGNTYPDLSNDSADVFGSAGGGSSSSTAPAIGMPTCIIDPWTNFGELTPERPRRSTETRKACGSKVCMGLLEGSTTWRGRPPPSWKRDAAKIIGQDCLELRVVPKVKTNNTTPAATELGLDGLNGGLEDLIGGGPASEIVRLEVRMEGLPHLPELSSAPQLRVLILSGNKLRGDLEALRHCPLLEEVGLCQNSLTSLDGLGHLSHLSILKATMNELTDVDDLAKLTSLRVVDLSKNRISSIALRAPGLAKLQLYRNSLDSIAFLQHLPSLTELDLGRNKLTDLDPQISEWNPLLVKVFLYENRLTSLPQLRLPLLTDLWIDNNALESLGPLGFLPSLERLQAKHNQIRSLATIASPLLSSVELAFNQLPVDEPPKIVLALPRLCHLQLNDNPVATELMEGYRPWVLKMAPQLEELDNETVANSERQAAVIAQATGQSLVQDLAWLPARNSTRTALENSQKEEAAIDHSIKAPSGGLLGLVAPRSRHKIRNAGPSEGFHRDEIHASPVGAAGAFAFDCVELGNLRRASLLGRWQAAWKDQLSCVHQSGGCNMCAMATWCEALTAARSAPIIAHVRDERRSSAALSSFSGGSARARDEQLFVLRRRRNFWHAFLELCGAQHDSLSPWSEDGSVCRTAAFEMPLPGAERSLQLLLRTVQARWRGVLGRRRCKQLRLEKRCEALPQHQRHLFTRVQAAWRGQAARNQLRASGAVLPGDRREENRRLAAVQLQAAMRGSRIRRRLRRAREMSQQVNDFLDDCPEVDVDALLGGAEDIASADPFSQLCLPTLPPAAVTHRTVGSARESRPRAPEAVPGLATRAPETERAPVQPASNGPIAAWSSPPPTALPSGATTRPQLESRDGSIASSPQSSRASSRPGSGFGGGNLPRRSKSLSSTAESAITEPDGHARRNKVEQVKEEWGFEDTQLAKSYLAAQRNRQRKPPAMPGLGSRSGPSSSSRGAVTPMNSRPRPPASTTKVGGTAKRSSGPGMGASCVKAQDAIAEFLRQEEAGRCASSSPTLEFQSGEPNLKLMRSSSLQGSGRLSGSPRARSPLHGFT